MKILLALFLIIVRIFVGFNILYWLVQEYRYPELHSITDIEFYIVFLIFDIWVAISNAGIELPTKSDESN